MISRSASIDKFETLRVLLISPHFAPSAAVGAKRFSFLAQQFEHLGHDVETLMLPPTRDDRLDSTLPRPGRVHSVAGILPHDIGGRGLAARLYGRFTRSVIGIPDHYIGWLPSSVAVGRRICRQAPPDVIIASGPPFTAFLTGGFLQRATGAPLILDYRDPWSAFKWGDDPKGRRMNGRASRRMERWAVRSAGALVFASAVMRERFEENYSGPRPDLLRVLTNGFNEPSRLAPIGLTPDAVNILYAGNFYGERRLSNLMEALGKLKSRPGSGEIRFAVHVFGKIKTDDWSRIAATGLKNLVYEHEPVDHNTILKYMKAADVLYLPSGSDVSYALPFKVFDYISVRRPILAVSPAGSAVARLIAELECGEISVEDEAGPIADALDRLLAGGQNYVCPTMESYTWEAIARRYNDVMQSVVARHQ